MGERGLKLSGGEKQRVAIARALLKATKIMCFDEATSALDTETEKQVQEAIDEVAKGSTSLMIAHRLSTVRNCDIIIALKHGVIMEQGSHDELLQKPDGYYRQLWDRQAESREADQKEKAEKAALLQELNRVYAERRLEKKIEAALDEIWKNEEQVCNQDSAKLFIPQVLKHLGHEGDIPDSDLNEVCSGSEYERSKMPGLIRQLAEIINFDIAKKIDEKKEETKPLVK